MTWPTGSAFLLSLAKTIRYTKSRKVYHKVHKKCVLCAGYGYVCVWWICVCCECMYVVCISWCLHMLVLGCYLYFMLYYIYVCDCLCVCVCVCVCMCVLYPTANSTEVICWYCILWWGMQWHQQIWIHACTFVCVCVCVLVESPAQPSQCVRTHSYNYIHAYVDTNIHPKTHTHSLFLSPTHTHKELFSLSFPLSLAHTHTLTDVPNTGVLTERREEKRRGEERRGLWAGRRHSPLSSAAVYLHFFLWLVFCMSPSLPLSYEELISFLIVFIALCVSHPLACFLSLHFPPQCVSSSLSPSHRHTLVSFSLLFSLSLSLSLSLCLCL